jgi:hypothetical protein
METTPNVGEKDRMARFGVGALLILLGVIGVLGVWSVIVGLVLAGTAYMRFCPAYRLLGMNTCQMK